MVVRPHKGRLCLTLQTDHAGATAKIAAAWGGSRFAPVIQRRESVLRSAEIHDVGWTEWEKRPTIRPDDRRPYSFLAIPQAIHTQIYTRGVQIARGVDPYAGLLISLHGAGLYNGRFGHMEHLPVRPTDPGAEELVARFLADQKQVQEELIAEINPDPTLLWTHYRWLQAWDGISLMLCMFEPTDGREILIGTMPTEPGGSEEAITLKGVGSETWSVSPWPFAGDQLQLAWPVRWVEDRPYESDEAFQAAFEAAPLEEQAVTLLPA
ncbi:MAG: DUF3891 family protein [Bacillota bacterium]